MSKSVKFPNDISMKGYAINQDKDYDGSKYTVKFILDPDYSKEVFDSLEYSNSCSMLKYDDRWNNYFWNCAGSYFCNDSFL